MRFTNAVLIFIIAAFSLFAAAQQPSSPPAYPQETCRPTGTGWECPQVPPQATYPGLGPGVPVMSTDDQARQTSAENEARDTRQQPPDRYRPMRQAVELNEFQRFVANSINDTLPIFGAKLFEGVPTTFAPVDRVPVTADYVIGPGDELLVRGWGQIDLNARVFVDRNGDIYVPKVGNITVAGLRYDELHEVLKSGIGRVFRNFELNVTLGQLRSIQVLVVGQARRPGAYTVSSLSTLVNALFASGGPSPTGSTRHIQLRRNGKTITDFDLYDLLLNGDKSKDARLLPGDVIYIPPVGALVALTGSVNVPAIYELRGNVTLKDALAMAGGLSATADGSKVTVERIDQRSARKVEEFLLTGEGTARTLQDGDIVRVVAVSPRFDNAVVLRGNVARPGRYPWRAGMRVRDLIPNLESLITPRYWAGQNRLAQAPDSRQRREGLPPIASLAPPSNEMTASRGEQSLTDDIYTEGYKRTVPPLSDRRTDREIRDERDTDADGTAYIKTEVTRTAPEINWNYAVVQRLSRTNLSPNLIPFDLGKAVLEGDQANNLELQPGDVVTIFSNADVKVPVRKQSKFVRLEGEFRAPGVYEVSAGETLQELIESAGGFTDQAYLYGAQFTRESTRREQQKMIDEFITKLESSIESNAASAAGAVTSSDQATALKQRTESQRAIVEKLRAVKATGRIVLQPRMTDKLPSDLPVLTLEDGDRFYVPYLQTTVTVIGSVFSETSLLYGPHKRFSDYLKDAGGPTRNADTANTFILRADGSIVRDSGHKLWAGSIDNVKMLPGDTIVVPEALNKVGFTREFKDWSQILSQMALGAAAIRVLQ